jgi:hypothetical protein
LFDEINQLLSVPHISVQSSQLHAGCLIIVAILQSTNYNHENGISQLREVPSHCVACRRSQIRQRLLVSLPAILPCLPNLDCKFLQKHIHPLPPNPFGIIEKFPRHTDLESLQKICNHRLPVHGSIRQLCQRVLFTENGPMLLFKRRSHPYCLPLVESSKVEQPYPFGKLLQGEFHLLQADCSFAFGPIQVQRIVALIIRMVFAIGNL